MWRQMCEMAYLFFFHRIGPGYYLVARFWRPEIPFSEKRKHWNGKRYLRYVSRLNDAAYFKISQNKLSEKSLLCTLALPTSPLIGIFHPTKGQDVTGRLLRDAEDLERVFLEHPGRLFLKPAEGYGGRGAIALDVNQQAGVLALANLFTGLACTTGNLASELSKEPMGYVIEHAIRQHDVIARLNPTSVNTIRIWVLTGSEGPKVAGAFLRVGRAGSVVDNTSQGGLSCAIDLDTGRIRMVLGQPPERTQHVVHPDSGVQMVDVEIPFWEQCVSLAERALSVLPGATFVGMDIALGTDGPLIVEYNVEPDHQGAAQFDIPHARIFALVNR